uniref:TFIID_NTD2 domain-containing protein n=1 Tax=Macrostomum lignano TaxID=282301 RepID=A0A1I8FN84_9PLAT
LTEEFESFADEFVRLRQVDLNYSSLEAIASRLRVPAAAVRPAGECHHRSVQHSAPAVGPGEPPGSQVLVNSWTYIAVRMAATEAGEAPEAKLQLPLKSGEDVLRAVEQELDRRPKVSNCLALMWISEAHVSTMKPDIVSWLLHDEVLPHRYSYLGTRDTSSFYVIPEALKFCRRDLRRSVYEYCRSLADEASSYLAGFWGTDLLPLPAEMQAPFMRLIRLPQHLQRPAIKKFAEETRFESNMWKFLAYKLKMDLMILNIEDSLFIRIAASIVVDMNDIRLVGDTMMRLKETDFVLD